MTTPQLPDPIRSVPAEPGTLDAVLTTARRRRARRLQVVVGAAASVALLLSAVAVIDPGGDSSQTIGVTDDGVDDPAVGPTDPPDSGTDPSDRLRRCGDIPAAEVRSDEKCTFPLTFTPSAAPTGAPGSAPGSAPTSGEPDPTAEPEPSDDPTTEPQPSPYPTPTKSSPPRPTPSPVPTRSSTAKPTPTPQPTGQPSEAARGPMRRTYIEGTVTCGGGQQWCGSARGAGNRPVDFYVRACRSADAGPGQLEVSPPEGDFSVYRDGEQVWRWSAGRAFPAVVGMLDVAAGDCYEWSTTWQGVDDYNNRLPAGAYEVIAHVVSGQITEPLGFRTTLT